MIKVKSNVSPVKSGLESGNTKVSFSPVGNLLKQVILFRDGDLPYCSMNVMFIRNVETVTYISTEISLPTTPSCKKPTAKKSSRN